MPLAEYRKKRDFKRTSEPRGIASKKRKKTLSYVIQKHAASRLHYDFRLEWNGVLKSWAVPKGPSLDPAVRSLAVEVEDHPIEYGKFEGTIPQGEYGGGTVLLWDRGTWTPHNDPAEGFRKGKLEFSLDGEKLHGEWHMVRMGPDKNGEGKNWLLFKSRDEHATPKEEFDVTQERPESVTTGRGLDEIAAGVGGKKTWSSNRPSKSTTRNKKSSARRVTLPTKAASAQKKTPLSLDLADVAGARKARQPQWISPQLAKLADQVPKGDEWLHEIKYDGYRFIAVKKGGSVRLITRNEKDWTHRFARVVQALAALPVKQAIFDGELVVLNAAGVSDFQSLQNAMQNGAAARTYYCLFDLLHCEGFDLTACTLLNRKKILAEVVAGMAESTPLRYSDHIAGSGDQMLEKACESGLEGIICKRADSRYEANRSGSWLKVKCTNEQEFVVGGFTDPQGARTGFGALLLGYYDNGEFRYCGRVGTGFNQKTLPQILSQLRPLEQESSAYARPPTGADARGVHWVKPMLVARIKYGSITSDGILRHPSFNGLRTDKPADEVTLETPMEKGSPAPAKKKSTPSKNAKSRRAAATKKSSEPASVAGITLTHPERVLWPDVGLTKLHLAKYYEAVGDAMLRHVGNRPLMLVRCPDGAGPSCFHQKHPSHAISGNLRTVPVREGKGVEKYYVLDDVSGLIGLTQMSVLEIHTWGSTAKDLERPDQMIFDLDPGPGVKWNAVTDAAMLLRDLLAALDFISFVKTSGGKGLHVVVPLKPSANWDQVKSFTQTIAAGIVQNDPDRFVGKMTKSIRAGKIYLDYLRNGRGATCVAAYSSRAREGAPVSLPISWNALKGVDDPTRFTIKNAPARVKREPNPWKGYFESRQALTEKLLRKLQIR